MEGEQGEEEEEEKDWVVVEKPSVEEEKVPEVEEEPSVYQKVEGPEAITELLGKIENRIIFMKHGIEKPGHLEAVESFG